VAGFDLTFKQIKGGFFDLAKIKDDVEKKHAKVQSKFGADTRRTMQTSLRYRKKASAPGQPPSVHRGKGGKSPLRELIFFSRDPSTNSVVIGPLAFKRKAARTLEQGGLTRIFDAEAKKYKTIYVRKRPFVRPAGDKEAKRFPDLLRSLVK
jgi:hypothetical protein